MAAAGADQPVGESVAGEGGNILTGREVGSTVAGWDGEQPGIGRDEKGRNQKSN